MVPPDGESSDSPQTGSESLDGIPGGERSALLHFYSRVGWSNVSGGREGSNGEVQGWKVIPKCNVRWWGAKLFDKMPGSTANVGNVDESRETPLNA